MGDMREIRNIVILTGAGVSAESGIDTFRSAGGLWENHRVEDVATPDAFARDPNLVLRFYDMRRAAIQEKEPNAAHVALARLEEHWPQRTGGKVLLVTQNVDDLHERAGSTVDAHVHGSLFALRCFACGRTHHGPLDDYVDGQQKVAPLRCTACGDAIRPGVVWFGEALPDDAWNAATDAATRCALMLVVGTSGLVYPAAGLPALARRHGATVVEINPEPTALSAEADHVWRSTAAETLPLLVG